MRASRRVSVELCAILQFVGEPNCLIRSSLSRLRYGISSAEAVLALTMPGRGAQIQRQNHRLDQPSEATVSEQAIHDDRIDQAEIPVSKGLRQPADLAHPKPAIKAKRRLVGRDHQIELHRVVANRRARAKLSPVIAFPTPEPRASGRTM